MTVNVPSAEYAPVHILDAEAFPFWEVKRYEGIGVGLISPDPVSLRIIDVVVQLFVMCTLTGVSVCVSLSVVVSVTMIV